MSVSTVGKHLKILHLTHQYPPDDMGGVEIYTRNVAQNQVSAGHRVKVIVPTQSGGLEQPREAIIEDGVEVVRVPVGQRSRGRVFAATWHDPTFASAFERHLDDVDIVHVQHLMGIPLKIFAQLDARNIPYVITLHDYWFLCINAQLVTNYDGTVCAGPDAKFANCGRCLVARANITERQWMIQGIGRVIGNRKKRLQKIFSGARQVIAVSQFVKDIYAEVGLAGDHVTVLRTGIDVPDYSLARGSQETVTRSGLHVVYLGSIAPPKGVDVLVRAFNQMPDDAVLTVAGGVEKFPEYVSELRAAATHPNISFVGQLGREQVWELLVSADTVVLPTLWYEASPITIGEFFAAGLPIVASDIGAVSEHIRHEVDGLLFPAGDDDALAGCLQRLYDDTELLAQMSANTPSVVTMETYAQQILDVYAACLTA